LPPFHLPRARHAAPRRTALPALLAAVSLTVIGCGGGGSDSSAPPAAAPPSTATATRPAVATKVTIGSVSGTVRRPFRKTFFQHRAHLQKQVGSAVDSWLDGGYVGVRYPRDSFPQAFASFTAAAKHDARRQQGLMTGWKWRHEIDGVTTRHRTVTLDVLAPHGRPAGVTARVRLVFTTSGKVKKRVGVTGRLFLARNPHGTWQIFGYDVAQGAK
jgi:hypothetical protein